MSWGPWIDSPPQLLSATRQWNFYVVTTAPVVGVSPPSYSSTDLNTALGNLQAGTGSTLENGASSDLGGIAPIEWEVAVSLEGPPPNHLEYSALDDRLLLSFSVTIPTLTTYPPASDSAVPGDPGTDGLVQYEGGTDSFYWSDFGSNWYTLSASPGSASDRLRLRFASWVDPTSGFLWPAYTAADTMADLLTNGTISIAMADWPAYRSAASFSIWVENGVEWSGASDIDFGGASPAFGAADAGGWQTDGLATWPRPYIQKPRYREWTGSGPNLNGARLADRIHFIPIRRRP